jgi:hypothetical protein
MTDLAIGQRRSTGIVAVAACAALTYAAVSVGLAHVSTRMLPWILGRGLGVAGYVALTALTAFGLWLRHPWRFVSTRPSARALHLTHAALAPLTLLLIAGHIAALSLDRYAGVGWTGAFVPGQASFRTTAVALGTVSLYVGLIVGLSAALAGWIGRAWLPIHRGAIAVFALTWLHGVFAGSDEKSLRGIYAVSALLILLLVVSRLFAQPPASIIPNDQAPQGAKR